MEQTMDTAPEATVEIVDIQFRPGQKTYFFDPDGDRFAPGDHVIIDTARGTEFGTCMRGNYRMSEAKIIAPLRKVIRRASPQDERVAADNLAREKRAADICRDKIVKHGLDMTLVRAECAFDGSKLLFYFTADERVDFRELVKDLAATFHTRIELRQIGVRDKSRLVGGLGICGRPLCCGCFLDEFQPVSIKMAKTQGLSLNPAKISGTCGRLMCCLKYEQEAYESLLRNCPKEESFVDTPEGRGTVTAVDLLRQQVKVQLEDEPETISTFSVDEIAVLRSGKARKGDAPIPPDLAPISGNGKRAHRKENPDEPMVLEPIRFRYRNESVIPEEPGEEEAEAPAPDAAPARHRRQNRESGHREPNRPRESRPAKADTRPPRVSEIDQDEEPVMESNPVRRRPNYRRRRPKRDR